jgi:hypothetical protein
VNGKSRFALYILALVTFCLTLSATSAAELQLAGIRLGRSAITVLQKYGNPSQVVVGAQTVTTLSGSSSASGMPGMPAAGGIPGMPMPGGMPGMPGGMPGMPMPGGMPGMPMPGGMPGMPAMSGSSSQAASSQSATIEEVTWIYKLSKSKSLEFIINRDGHVVQIATYGVEWPGMHTSLGIGLGSTYKDIIRKYGWPESHEKKGIELVMKYPDKHRVTFTLLDQTVVGITIALMD